MSIISSSPSKEPKCQCGVPMGKLTSWTRENPGRKFRACKFYDPIAETRGCKAFQWVDQLDGTEWQTQVINNLLLDKKLLKAEALTADRKKMNREVKQGKRSSIGCLVSVSIIIVVAMVVGGLGVVLRGV
ncbi:uncharacterized protein LOC110715874 [Chenopodium quinoa]|uniref:uncharacterized protein LOC110715874 n=1 Tax=Chenopodium quinoa TaxID=63459 RepID=UPI000B76E589|nr:uncharacterized protein LOC110715874 [Chenopodium quinoa]